MATSEAQKRARDKWDAKNKEKKKIIILKANAKRFIREFANEEDIKNIKEYVIEREKILQKQ